MTPMTSVSSFKSVYATVMSQVLFALLAPGDRVANIMQATVASAGASQVCNTPYFFSIHQEHTLLLSARCHLPGHLTKTPSHRLNSLA